MNLSVRIFLNLALVILYIQAQIKTPLIECTVDDLVCVEPVAGVELQPVCAWFNPQETKCKNELCNDNVDFVCNACSLPGIIGYTLGKCPDSLPVKEPPTDIALDTCDDRKALATNCLDIYAPVCAYFSCSKDAAFDAKCSQTYPNRCTACLDPNVIYIIPGECPDVKIAIDPIIIDPLPISIVNPIHLCPSTLCPKIWKPVCGWFDASQIQCIKYPCAQTYANSCLACKDPKVIGFTPGPCPKGPPIIISPPIDKAAVSVSAALPDAKAAGLITIDVTVDASITPLPVDYLCTSALQTADCSTYKYDPVCGIILDINYCASIGQTTPCYLTYNNSCLACHDPKVHAYDYYLISTGKCPKAPPSPYPSNLIRCIKKLCPLIYAPVCAIQLPCSHTYSNSCFACLNSNTIGYTNGPCPNTLPILDPFDKYTCTAADRFSKILCQPTQSYNYVCAYLNYKCTYGQCTTYYANKCNACHNVAVVSVTPGLCPNEKKWFRGVKSYVCKDEDRDLAAPCPEFDIGVCAIMTQGIGSYPNVCTACKDPDVIEVFNKACPSVN